VDWTKASAVGLTAGSVLLGIGLALRGSSRAKAAGLGAYEYRMAHRPPTPEAGAPLHDLTKQLPADIYDHPEWYDGGEPGYRHAWSVAATARNRPDAMVWIYRSAPRRVKVIHPGDWVTTSRQYAKSHGRHAADPKKDWPVLVARVRADQLVTSGDSLLEWGYWGPKIRGAGSAREFIDRWLEEPDEEAK